MWKQNPATAGREQGPGLAPPAREPARRCGASSPNRTTSSRKWRALTNTLGLLVLAMQLGAQSLQILPSPPLRDGRGTFRIMIVSPPENPVLALQWRVAVAKGADIAADGIEPSPAATAAGKEVTCREVEKEGRDGSAYVCILAGGRQIIPDGPVAVIRLLARDGDSSVTVRLSGIKAVTIETKAKIIPDIEAAVPVRARRDEK